MTANQPNKPWFIHDQQWSVLTATNEREIRAALKPELMRPGRITETEEVRIRDSQWQVINDREEVIFNLSSISNDRGQPIDYRLLAIVSDAGIGKSKVAEWLHYRFNHPSPPVIKKPAPGEQTNSPSRINRIHSQPMAFLFRIDGMRIVLGPNRAGTTRIKDENDLIEEIANCWWISCQNRDIKVSKPVLSRAVFRKP